MDVPFRQMHAVCADPVRQRLVRSDQEHKPAPPCDDGQSGGCPFRVRPPEAPENHARTARQRPGDSQGIRSAIRIGDEKDGGKRCAGLSTPRLQP